MTKDDLIEALAKNLFEWNVDEGEWWSLLEGTQHNYRSVIASGPLPLIVEFVADWIEHCTDRLITGYDADVLLDAWREEMDA